MKMLFILFIAIVLSGCIPYPIYKTLQPSATAKVLDFRGNPIPEAKVVIISSSYPYRLEKFRKILYTDDTGEVRFQKINEWRTEALMLHGAESFFWNWCVSKEGYVTILTRHTGNSDFEQNPVFTLVPGTSEPCKDVF